MIRVLLVDDSEVSLLVLQNILETEPDISVVGRAKTGNEAIGMVSRLCPDIITMDINMPGLDGFSTTRQIMESTPVPIIIVSGIDNLEDIRASFKAVEAGALAVFRKPPAYDDPLFQSTAEEFLQAIRTYSEVKVIKRRQNVLHKPRSIPVFDKLPIHIAGEIQVIVIGASTGGPQAMQEILLNLPHDFPLPLVLVQHMSPGFIEGLAIWLTESTGFPTRIGSEGDFLIPGVLFIAPDGKHTGITSDLRILFSESEPLHNLRPAVSYLFQTAALNIGKHVAGILLTGMGKDGADELLLIRQKGGLTITQDKNSSFIYGMPGAAEALQASMYSLSPKNIAQLLFSITGRMPDAL